MANEVCEKDFEKEEKEKKKKKKSVFTIHAFHHHHHAQLTTWQSPSHDNNMQSTTHFSCTISEKSGTG